MSSADACWLGDEDGAVPSWDKASSCEIVNRTGVMPRLCLVAVVDSFSVVWRRELLMSACENLDEEPSLLDIPGVNVNDPSLKTGAMTETPLRA